MPERHHSAMSTPKPIPRYRCASRMKRLIGMLHDRARGAGAASPSVTLAVARASERIAVTGSQGTRQTEVHIRVGRRAVERPVRRIVDTTLLRAAEFLVEPVLQA